MGTQDGVYRFDGKAFEKFEIGTGTQLLNWKSIETISYIKQKNMLLVACPNNGFAVYNTMFDKHFFQQLVVPHTIALKYSSIFFIDNFFYIASSTALIKFQIKQKANFFLAEKVQVFENLKCIASYVDEHNNFYALDAYSILSQYKITGNQIQTVKTVNLNSVVPINSKYIKIIVSNDILFMAGLSGLEQINLNFSKTGFTKKINNGENILSLEKDSLNNIYYSTRQHLYQLKNGIGEIIIPENSNVDAPSNATISCISKIGNCFYLGLQNGLSIWSPGCGLKRYNATSSGSPLGQIYHITVDSVKKLILISSEKGLYQLDINSNVLSTISNKEAFLQTIPLHDNTWLISGTSRLFYLNSQQQLLPAINKFPELKPFGNFAIGSYVQLPDKSLLLSSFNGKGLFMWDVKKHVATFDTMFIFDHKKITQSNNLYLHKNDLFLLGDTAIYYYNLVTKQRRITKVNYGDKFYGIFMDMCRIGNKYFISSYGNGIVVCDSSLKPLKIINTKMGLSNDGVYELFNIGDTACLATSNNGLNFIYINKNIVKQYYKFQGLHNNAFEQFSGGQFKNIIYVGGKKGFSAVNLQVVLASSMPDIHPIFTNVEMLQNGGNIFKYDIEEINSFKINSNTVQTTINFQAMQFPLSDSLIYYYRLAEISNEWINIGSKNSVTLIGVSPGKYNLEVKVKATTNQEVLFQSFALFFLPKWYQTLLFKIIVVLFVTALLFILYNFRIRQLKKVLAVRRKISQNLHDDIGSTLSAINMYTQVAKLQPQENDFINSIEENTQDALGKLDDIIWSTNPKNDKVKNLVDRMDGFARPLLQAKNIKFNFTHSDITSDQKIGEAVRQNLFVIFKEAVNNVAKYSDCITCSVVLEEKNKVISCSITDDGKGFDVEKPTERNGILNMQMRAKEMKGVCSIVSAPMKGTSIKLQLPF